MSTTEHETRSVRAAVLLWEDAVGDSGNAPSDEELATFYRAAQVAALREAAEDAWTMPLAREDRPYVRQWLLDRVTLLDESRAPEVSR